MTNRYIPDAECKQGRCALPTTGCRGICHMEEHPGFAIVGAPVDVVMVYGAPITGAGALPRALGVSRDAASPGGKSVLVSFERALSDDELRALLDILATGPAAKSAPQPCAAKLRAEGRPYPRTCPTCKLGPCTQGGAA